MVKTVSFLFVFAALGLFGQQAEQASSAPGYFFVPSEANPIVTQPVLTLTSRTFGTVCQGVNNWKWVIQRNVGQSGYDIWVPASSLASGESPSPIVINFRQRQIDAGSLRISVLPVTETASCSSPMALLYFNLYTRGPAPDPQAWYNLTFLAPSGQWNDQGVQVFTPNISRPAIGALTYYYAYQLSDWGDLINDVYGQVDKNGVLKSSLGAPFDTNRQIFAITINGTTGDSVAQSAKNVNP